MSTIDLIQEVEAVDLNNYKYDYRTGHPAVCVGTYHKYNCGSLFGMWMDLTKFADFEEFMNACRFLHNDESCPELMFQDYENYPEEWYSESFMGEVHFNMIQRYAELDDKDVFDAFMDVRGGDYDSDDESVFDEYTDKFCGVYDSKAEFAEQLADETCMLDNVPESMRDYIDFDAMARDLFICDYDYSGGFVFRRY